MFSIRVRRPLVSAIYLSILIVLVSLKIIASVLTGRAERKEKIAATRVNVLHDDIAGKDAKLLSGEWDYKLEAKKALATQQLGWAIESSEKSTARAEAWKSRMESLGNAIAWVWGAKGRAMPYTFGIADSVTVMVALDQISLATGMTIPQLVSSVVAMFTGSSDANG